MATESLAPRDLTLTAADGYQLAGTLYPASQPRGQILVGSATGVPQGFYRRFAEFAARNGFTTLTLDYRGIGASAPADQLYEHFGITADAVVAEARKRL